MLTSMAGPRVDWRFGQVLTVGEQISEEEALRWIAGGVCEPVAAPASAPPLIETAALEPVVEVAAQVRRPRGRPRKVN